MSDVYDVRFEQAMCDHWWVQDNAQVVKKKEVEYLRSAQNSRLYNAVVRVSPNLKEYQPVVDEVMSAHRGKGSEWRIGAPSYTAALESAVLTSRYELDGVADCWTIEVNSARPAMPNNVVIERVSNLQGLRDMESIMVNVFSKLTLKNQGELLKELEFCTGKKARCFRFVAYDKQTKQPLSAGGVNLYPDLALGFLWGGCTIPAARGRGIYSAMVTQRMKMAQKQGVETIGLYAMRDTSGPIVQSQGFCKHGPVHFWGRKHTP